MNLDEPPQFKVVKNRHHSVHRAGYEKDRKEVEISKGTILGLLDKIDNIAGLVISTVDSLKYL